MEQAAAAQADETAVMVECPAFVEIEKEAPPYEEVIKVRCQHRDSHRLHGAEYGDQGRLVRLTWGREP